MPCLLGLHAQIQPLRLLEIQELRIAQSHLTESRQVLTSKLAWQHHKSTSNKAGSPATHLLAENGAVVLALQRPGVGRAELGLLPLRQLAVQLLGRLPRARQLHRAKIMLFASAFLDVT